MFACVQSGTLCGLQMEPIRVEAAICSGLPSFQIVGLPANAVSEARVRVKAALIRSGFSFPRRKVLINLAPAELRKESSLLDMPIALAILAAVRTQLKPKLLSCAVFGELSLDGAIHGSDMVMALTYAAARAGFKHVLVPSPVAQLAARVPNIEVRGFDSLSGVVQYLLDQIDVPPVHSKPTHGIFHDPLDYRDVQGLDIPKRGLVIAAAGGHHALISGPPGVGKSMLARRFPSILPRLDKDRALELSCLRLALGAAEERDAADHCPPFRSPHYSVTTAGLIGGGCPPKAGEVSLAHHGVLFLDELLEYGVAQLEALRTPIEEGVVRIARYGARVVLPCKLQLIAAHNPCPCGFSGHPNVPCRCTPRQLERYRNKLSGPLMDRIDIGINISTSAAAPIGTGDTDSSTMRQLVESAILFRGTLDRKQGRSLSPSAVHWLTKIGHRGTSISMRRRNSLMRVASTIADLEESRVVEARHIDEALFFQPRLEA